MSRVITRVVRKRPGIVFDVDVSRPSIYGNPYAVDRGRPTQARFLVPTLTAALRGYEDYLTANAWLVELAREKLKGLILGCWCVDDRLGVASIVCHAQILARVADGAVLPILKRGRVDP